MYETEQSQYDKLTRCVVMSFSVWSITTPWQSSQMPFNRKPINLFRQINLRKSLSYSLGEWLVEKCFSLFNCQTWTEVIGKYTWDRPSLSAEDFPTPTICWYAEPVTEAIAWPKWYVWFFIGNNKWFQEKGPRPGQKWSWIMKIVL